MKESRFYRMVYAIAALAMCFAGCTGTQEGSFDNLTETLKQYQIISVDSGYITVAGKNQITDKATGAVYTPQGLVDPEGRLVVPLEYEKIVARDTWRTGVVVVSRNGKSGLADLNGNEVAACQYDAIISFIGDYAIAKKGNMAGVIDNKGNEAIPFIYEFISPYYTEYNYLGYNEKYHYESVFNVISGGRREVINLSRQGGNAPASHTVAPYDYQIVKENGKYGYVNYLGGRIPCQYENARDTFSQGLAAVVKGGKIGFIDKTGAVKIPFQFEYSEFLFNYLQYGFAKFSEGLCAMRRGNMTGYIDRNGNTVIPYEYLDGGMFLGGQAVVFKDTGHGEKNGVIDRQNHTVIPFEYDAILYIEGDKTLDGIPLYAVMKNGKWGLRTLQGDVLVDCQYEQTVLSFFQGYTNIEQNGKTGLMDSRGNVVIAPEYVSLNAENGLVWARKEGEWGVLDVTGRTVIPFGKEEIYDISRQIIGHREVLVVSYKNKVNICDLDGRNLLE